MMSVDEAVVTPVRNAIAGAEVRTGAALLDRENPGWRDKIDVFALDLNNVYNCILGQLYGSYDAGKKKLGINAGIGFGFNPMGMPELILRKAWVEEITNGKDAA